MLSTGAARRRFRITVRVSLEERDRIDAVAVRAGLTTSGYARAVLFAAKPLRAARRPVLEFKLLARALVHLGALVTVLRELASKALTPLVERELLRALVELRTCRTQLLKALGRKVPSP